MLLYFFHLYTSLLCRHLYVIYILSPLICIPRYQGDCSGTARNVSICISVHMSLSVSLSMHICMYRACCRFLLCCWFRFWCDVCECLIKDSAAYLDHINGRNHNRMLGKPLAITIAMTKHPGTTVLAVDASMVKASIAQFLSAEPRSDSSMSWLSNRAPVLYPHASYFVCTGGRTLDMADLSMYLCGLSSLPVTGIVSPDSRVSCIHTHV